jgi:hypothetical protein
MKLAAEGFPMGAGMHRRVQFCGKVTEAEITAWLDDGPPAEGLPGFLK